jgi:steroid 5-alpha reductase family enzyme
MNYLKALILLLIVDGVHSFLPAKAQANYLPQQAQLTDIANIRGGSSQLHALMPIIPDAVSFVTANLQAGPLGVLALTSIAASVCLPMTQIKNLYGISVGYGSSVAAMGLVLRLTFGPAAGSFGDILTQSTIFYGARLAGYLLLRDLTSWRSIESRSEPPRFKRIPFALSLALFYGFMTTPVLYALRHGGAAVAGWKSYVSWTGAGMAWAGAILEAVADNQKYVVKQRTGIEESNVFHGPSNGAYRLTRHPNYTGEILFWFGTWLAGVPFFGRSAVGWICSSVGLYGIVSIMRSSTKKLEERHAEKYGGQEEYENWKKKVTAPLIPFVKNV